MNTNAHHRFHGIYPMLYAFFDAKGGIDREAMERQIHFCLESGVQGVATLGLATEVDKLSAAERRQILDITATRLAGRLPLSVTVFGNSVDEQVNFCHAAEAAGADWVVLQPPRIKGLSETDCRDFFGAVMARVALPVGIQNAPEFLDVSLTIESIERLRQRHQHFIVLKGEGPVTAIAEVVAATGGEIAVFNGRNGLELPDNLRAGCAGMIPSPGTGDWQAKIYVLMSQGTADAEAEAERLYRNILPLLIFEMQSLESLWCYGKRIVARRLGLPAVHDRAPGQAPTPFGMAVAIRHADRLFSD